MLTSLLAFALISVASAQDLRDVDGHPVELDAQPTAVVSWSLGCTSCVAAMRELNERDVLVVAVSSDPVQARSSLKPYLRARGVEVTIVSDPTGSIWRDLTIGAEYEPGDAIVWRGAAASLAATRVAVQ